MTCLRASTLAVWLAAACALAACAEDDTESNGLSNNPPQDAAVSDSKDKGDAPFTPSGDGSSGTDADAPVDPPDGPSGTDSGTSDSETSDSPPDTPVDTPPACTEGELLAPLPDEAPRALLVTSDALAASFQRLALYHTLAGIPTAVVTMETLCGGTCSTDPKADGAKFLKDHLQQQTSITYVILGGDLDIVPAREVHDTYQNPLMADYTYDEDFYTDYYYSDLSEWDQNKDGVYAEDGVDYPDYRPELAVARIPVSSSEEADRYIEKVIKHTSAYDMTKVKNAFLVSNVAANFLQIDIDGAFYFQSEGRTLGLLPDDFSVKKMYATHTVDMSAELTTVEGQVRELASGHNLVVHNGHSGVGSLTVEMDGTNDFTDTMAYNLQNSTLPLFLSCGCEAGAFQANDSAGEQIVNAPLGGAIAYLGNSVIGLGLAGGMQLIDTLLFYLKTTPDPLLGDAYWFAHNYMPEQDTFAIPVLGTPIPVVDQDSYEWTQKAVVLFGDPLIPVWTVSKVPAPQLTWTTEPICNGTRIHFTLPVAMTGTLRMATDTARFSVEITGPSDSVDLPITQQTLTAVWTAPTQQWGYYTISTP